MSATVRFAPSPTGYIHIGNARTALFNWLLARRAGGRFILRLDDTDRARSTDAFAAAIAEDLAWLGVRPDQVVRQSDRFGRYDAVKADLVTKGLLYPAYETAEELEYGRRRRRARGLPPVYDRAALRLTADDRARLEAEGRQPHWRFLLPNFAADPFQPERREVHWDDLCRGPQTVDLGSLSDPVLIRADGTYLYTLPSVIDDLDLGVTHVIRGEDHVTNTGVQIAIFEALGGPVPAFGHHNLLTDASGEGLSKRTGALSLRSLREKGLEPEAVAALAVGIGTSHAVEPVASLDDLAAGFDPAAASRSAARFDPADLDHLNARTVHALPFERAAPRLQALGIPPDPAFWSAVAGNCATFAEASLWWRVVTGEGLTPIIAEEDRAFLGDAARLLPPEPFDADTFRAWTGALKDATGRKGRALFMPLRLALTGLDHGPEMAALLPLVGRAETLRRLAA
ncbi:glutamate--tRNA ligase [Chthonobacter rhizosphaerae]|uniref:glutamate--tRNA ligase n=1 Tax=Chthonobacter rhizosphaerae TaxID=2735553 RepID=UPI0015EFC81F|nr:glutamate--tRNA ligase [Chthonobacter rhizosphaerae]